MPGAVAASVEFEAGARADCEAELAAARRKADFFERVFDRPRPSAPCRRGAGGGPAEGPRDRFRPRRCGADSKRGCRERTFLRAARAAAPQPDPDGRRGRAADPARDRGRDRRWTGRRPPTSSPPTQDIDRMEMPIEEPAVAAPRPPAARRRGPAVPDRGAEDQQRPGAHRRPRGQHRRGRRADGGPEARSSPSSTSPTWPRSPMSMLKQSLDAFVNRDAALRQERHQEGRHPRREERLDHPGAADLHGRVPLADHLLASS